MSASTTTEPAYDTDRAQAWLALMLPDAYYPERADPRLALLKKLTRTQRKVVYLRVSCGLTFSEVGRLLGIRQRSAINAYHAALGRLELELDE